MGRGIMKKLNREKKKDVKWLGCLLLSSHDIKQIFVTKVEYRSTFRSSFQSFYCMLDGSVGSSFEEL
jgi:hypothetical protein